MNIFKNLKQDTNLVLTNHYKPYKYTEKDCNNNFQPYEVLKIDTIYPIEVKHGLLTVGGNPPVSIGKTSIKDFINILRKMNVTVTLFKGFEDFQKIPSIMIRDFNNIVSKTDIGAISPIQVDKDILSNNVVVLDTKLLQVEVADIEGNKVSATSTKDKIYFEPNKDNTIYQIVMITSFYVYVDFAPKRITSAADVSYLLNFKENN